ncbi:universal stress protein UspA [Cupriavidus sp. USMAA2-4]|uniref:Universal stress protein UspA n=1 Tax=Cupriavidus malaysiensis TaxID=367825 RepID=A0A1D9HZP5_9BURK|nr:MULTISPECIES: universal stress protein [Cupriavidus]AOY91727.1 universal stress protein UspA [Cupriavidus sp. USMAA2-4]AOY98715.1 universal stress protein UspA [Cupriavidus sp. USMAHM13]AOZ05145.1 universal stress protein UspA [Cupriavidus malaysiensis]
MSNIVLATDGSPFSDAAARSIVEGRLLKAGFTVHVVHVTPDVTGQVRAFVSKETIDEWHKEESEKAMQSVCDILKAGNIPFEAHSLRGFAPERIVAHAGETKAEAIVMGTHGRGTFFDAVIGSVAGRVLAMAPCPVLLIKGERAK